MTTATMLRIASTLVSTKRAVVTDLKRAAATTYLTGIYATPLTPVDPELRATLELNTPHELLRTSINGAPDIREGDLLVVGSNQYPIRSAAQYPAVSSTLGTYMELIVEDLKR
jgi:hypothetical protein